MASNREQSGRLVPRPQADTACQDKVQSALKSIEQSSINAFISVDTQGALEQARQRDQSRQAGEPLGALHGMTLGVKDLIDVAGMRTTMGSAQYQDYVAPQNALVVQALHHAGVIILGKTNTHEFAYGSTGDRSFFGPVQNPHRTQHISGGSSSGSAAAVAAGLCDAALGTDTSASVRLPAALCGVVGIKPTYDLLPRDGVFDLSQSLDHVGVITQSVADNARVLHALTALLDPQHNPSSDQLNRNIKGMKIGVMARFYGEYVSAEVEAAFVHAQSVLSDAGGVIVEVDIPEIMTVYNNQQTVLKYEALANHQEALAAGGAYSDEVRARLLGGAEVSAEQYAQAKAYQATAKAAFDTVLNTVDVMLTPTCGIVAPRIYERSTSVNGTEYSTFWLLTRHTAPTNFSGHPSLSVPFGQANGLPIGMQLIGRFYDESTLYQVAQVIEQGNSSMIDIPYNG